MNTRETMIASASLQVTPVVDLWDLFYRCFKHGHKNPNLSIATSGSATHRAVHGWSTSLTIDGRVVDFRFVWGNADPRAHIAVEMRILANVFTGFHVDLAWVGEPKYREHPPKDIWMFAMAKALLEAQKRIKEAKQ